MGFRQVGGIFIISNDKDMTQGKQIDILWKAVTKQGKYIEKLEKDVAIVKRDSHPPVFEKDQYEDLVKRLEVVEAFIDNIQLISKGELN